jgi:predicted DsbA family dithiol-disulfide isomerase
MIIEVWADVVCPWSYLGKHRLESVLREFPGDVRLTFRAYQLDPDPVTTPIPVRQAMASTVGEPSRVERMFAQVTELAAADGLPLDLDRAVVANTFDAHRLVAWAAGQELQLSMVETLQRAHFVEGVDLGSHAELARLAGTIGLDERAARDYLASSAGADSVRADLEASRQLGIANVPAFVIDERFVIQGAQEVPVLRAALEEIARREEVDPPR